MDWPTGLGLIMGIIATADLAYKYGSALLKKINQRPRAGKNDTPFGKPNLISIGGHHYVPRHLLLKKI